METEQMTTQWKMGRDKFFKEIKNFIELNENETQHVQTYWTQ